MLHQPCGLEDYEIKNGPASHCNTWCLALTAWTSPTPPGTSLLQVLRPARLEVRPTYTIGHEATHRTPPLT
jgi:hypothetical protein